MPHALFVNVQVSVSPCYIVDLRVHLPKEENGYWWNGNGACAMRPWFLADIKAGRWGVRAQLVLLCC